MRAPLSAPIRQLDPASIRKTILEQSRRANVGHIGSSLSVVEILCAVYEILNTRGAGDPERDRFVLSKGHAALALYATLAEARFFDPAALDTFCGEDTHLGVHPEIGLNGIDFAAGSLGQGLSLACGAALAARMQHSGRRIFCLVSDAECNEGSIWEAAAFAAHHRLGSLTAIVDVNGQQALGRTRDVLDQTNLDARWSAFGWRVTEVDGHSIEQLRQALAAFEPFSAPTVILANTVLGKGVSFMEQGRAVSQTHIPVNPVNWHYLPMSAQEFDQAMAEVSLA